MNKRPAHIFFLLPVGIYFLHSWFYRDWLVDDAAISVAYAQNLAAGHGLLSQPGRPPVEAFSNPLWVFLLAFAKFIGLFHLYATPKLMAGAAVLLAAYWVCRMLMTRYDLPSLSAALFLCLPLLNAPFVCWVNAGLENGLYILGITALLGLLLQKKPPPQALIGIVVGGLALIRPEGILFGLVWAIWWLKKWDSKAGIRALLFALGLTLSLGIYQLFRVAYFGEILPTPFYAKMGNEGRNTDLWLKFHHVFRTLTGPLGGLTGIIFVFVAFFSAFRQKFVLSHLLPLAAWLCGIFIFLILPYDHLGWYRYASPFIWLSYLMIAILVREWTRDWNKIRKRNRIILWIMGGLFAIGHVGMGVIITQKRSSHPPVPYREVAQRYGHRFNDILESQGIEQGKILVPDIGATLLVSKHEAYDFLGLVDPLMAKTYQRDSARYTDYIFEEIKPDLIGCHGLWLEDRDWQQDPRLVRDYEIYSRAPLDGGIEALVYIRKADN